MLYLDWLNSMNEGREKFDPDQPPLLSDETYRGNTSPSTTQLHMLGSVDYAGTDVKLVKDPEYSGQEQLDMVERYVLFRFRFWNRIWGPRHFSSKTVTTTKTTDSLTVTTSTVLTAQVGLTLTGEYGGIGAEASISLGLTEGLERSYATATTFQVKQTYHVGHWYAIWLPVDRYVLTRTLKKDDVPWPPPEGVAYQRGWTVMQDANGVLAVNDAALNPSERYGDVYPPVPGGEQDSEVVVSGS